MENKQAAGAFTRRPKVLDRFKRIKGIIKKATALENKLKPRVKEILETSTFSDFTLIESVSRTINAELAIQWLRKEVRRGNIDKETFKSMFIRVFDQNAFVNLIKTNRARRRSLPKGIITVKKSTSVRMNPEKRKKKL